MLQNITNTVEYRCEYKKNSKWTGTSRNIFILSSVSRGKNVAKIKRYIVMFVGVSLVKL